MVFILKVCISDPKEKTEPPKFTLALADQTIETGDKLVLEAEVTGKLFVCSHDNTTELSVIYKKMLGCWRRKPSFHDGDNSVHLHECSPFWVGIFITFNKENYNVYCLM